MSVHAGDIPSPCVRNCCLDDKDVCMGCFRTITEIIGWSQSSNQQREAILALAEDRKN